MVFSAWGEWCKDLLFHRIALLLVVPGNGAAKVDPLDPELPETGDSYTNGRGCLRGEERG